MTGLANTPAPPHPMEDLSGWGRFPRAMGRATTPATVQQAQQALRGAGRIARGNGRAYGDAAQGVQVTLRSDRLTRMLSFDAGTGQLVAEAGVQLGDIIDTFLPRGWFPAVTPGTKFVTLGGAIAADVHGKNHHIDGTFGRFVDWIELAGPDGAVRRVHPGEALFDWTLGGMGLTGMILRAAIRLRRVESGWIRQKTVPARNLAAAMAAFDAAQDATYSVAWIDCLARGRALGRSLLMLGEHASAAEVPRAFRARPFATRPRRARTVPCNAPNWALNPVTVKAFNHLYWRRGASGPADALVDWDSYFYPLDAVLGWNRIYGRQGFVQFQCALPESTAHAGLTALLQATSSAGQGSFLAVLKRFGAEARGMSFPMPGYTLALDFPATPAVLALLDRLDAITLEHGGRFYLAKDARMTADTLHSADPRARALRAFRKAHDLSEHAASAQSERLFL